MTANQGVAQNAARADPRGRTLPWKRTKQLGPPKSFNCYRQLTVKTSRLSFWELQAFLSSILTWLTDMRCWRSSGVSLPFRRNWQSANSCLGGSFGVVYKAIEKATGDVVAIKHVRTQPRVCLINPNRPPQIDLEGSDDDLREIQQEISLLSTCASPFVTHYKTSFIRGVKLWIVMEYLGGGSCLDLVGFNPIEEEAEERTDWETSSNRVLFRKPTLL